MTWMRKRVQRTEEKVNGFAYSQPTKPNDTHSIFPYSLYKIAHRDRSPVSSFFQVRIVRDLCLNLGFSGVSGGQEQFLVRLSRNQVSL